MATARVSEKKQEETLQRLRAATHLTQNLFSEHQTIEGYYEDREVPDFYGCDRLLKLDNLYGTTQLGYDPKRGISFLFSNIKTSVYDTAASAYQRRLRQTEQRRQIKSGTQNIAYSARRREASATILYKAENKPWSEESVRHYMARVNMETLRKTMPFLDRQQELDQRTSLHSRQRETGRQVQQMLQQNGGEAVQALRAEQVRQKAESETLDAILVRKHSQSRQFFRKINMAFDLQKQKMFAYYRNEKEKRAEEAATAAANAANDAEKDENDDQN